VFSNKGASRDWGKSCSNGNISEFEQGIFIGSVSIDHYDNSWRIRCPQSL
jgi:hypothetical protein